MSYRIFLVEDHPVMREAYAQLLDLESDMELCGMAESAEGFLEVLDATPCDIVVTDLSLPGMDGIAMLEIVRTSRPDLPAIVISAHEEAAYQQRAKRAGARAYVTKRHLARDLGPTIRRVMNGSNGAA